MDAAVASPFHRDEDIPLCPRMVGIIRSDPKAYLCDIPADLRKRFLGNTPCSAHAGCVPREKDPEAVQNALLDGIHRMYRLRTPPGAK